MVLVLIFGNTSDASAQRLSKTESAQVKEVCQKKTEYTRASFEEPLFDINLLKPISSRNAFLLDSLYAQFIFLNDYKMTFDSILSYEVIQNRDSLYCKLERSEGKSSILNVVRQDSLWKVTGYGRGEITLDDVAEVQLLVDSSKLALKELKRVEESTSTFFKGINDMYLNKNTQVLQSVTSDSSFILSLLEWELDTLQKNRFRAYEIKELSEARIRGEGLASCRVKIERGGSSTFYLERVNGDWKVVGENENRDLTERINNRKQSLIELKKALDIKGTLMEFNQALKRYFLLDQQDSLRLFCSADFLYSLKRIKEKCGDYEPKYLTVNGIRGSIIRYGIDFHDSHVAIDLGQDSLLINQTEKGWQLTNIKSLSNKTTFNLELEENFESIFEDLGLYHSYYTHSDDTYVIADVALPDEEEEDMTVRHQLERVKKRPQFVGGTKELMIYLNAPVWDRFDQSLEEEEYVHVKFIIEKDGSTSAHEVIGNPHPTLDTKALEIARNLPPWLPAVSYSGNVRAYYVLPIYFGR